MSDEFYKSTAKQLLNYLTGSSLKPGMRFWLRLDNQEQIAGIDTQLQARISSHGKLGSYIYRDISGRDIYKTYTLMIDNMKIVFVPQTTGMEADFLATLRNAARNEGFVFVGLTEDKLDTVDSATQRLDAPGMPFNESVLRKEVEKLTKSKAYSAGERTLIAFALERMDEDRFTDKTSLGSYEQFLTIKERGYITDDDFIAFKMFPDKSGLDACQRVGDRKTKDRLSENADRFDEINRAFESDSVNEELGSRYTKKALGTLRDRKAAGQTWYEGIDYKTALDWVRRTGNEAPIELFDDSLEVYSPSNSGDIFYEGQNYFVKPEGTTKAQRRKRHIIICVSEEMRDIELRYKTSVPMREDHIDKKKCHRVEIGKTSTRVNIRIPKLEKNATFAQAAIQKNVISIMVVRALPQFLHSIETRYSIDVKKNQAKSSIWVDVDGGRLLINPSGEQGSNNERFIENGGIYSCHKDQALLLKLNDEDRNDDAAKIGFSVSCGGCIVPFTVKLDRRIIPKLTADIVYKEKIVAKKSFQIMEAGKLQLATREFDVEDEELLNAIRLEAELLKKGWLSATIKNGSLTENELQIPEQIVDAYYELYEALIKMRCVPTLAYVGTSSFRKLVTRCVNEVMQYVDSLEENAPASKYDDLLSIGVIYEQDEHKRILFSPLHPINLAYQLNVLDAGEIIDDDEENDQLITIAIAKLGASQAIPFIHHDEDYYEVSDSLSLPEWTCYYTIDSDAGRGIEATVTKVVRERIEDYLNHFSFMFNSGKKALRVACVDLGSCEGVLKGIIEYLFVHFIEKNKAPEAIVPVHVDCYGKMTTYTAFENLLNRASLEDFLKATGYMAQIEGKSNFDECMMLLLSHVSFSTHNAAMLDGDDRLQYEHIAFARGASRLEPTQSGIASEQDTGIMMNGAIAVTSTTDTDGWFKTGFGTRNAHESQFLNLLQQYNSLYAVADSPASFSRGKTILAGISHNEERSYEKIYEASNWVVLLDPKVDPLHFARTGNDELLIIHYTDQETTNGYDAITVTKKSKQYEGVVQEGLAGTSYGDIHRNVRDVINFANAFNGTWLLSFLNSTESQVPRSRMSMLAAVKAAICYYHCDEIVWVPLSLEEVLRVSRGLKLSAATEINSYKSLGFTNGPKSDDIMLVGITGDPSNPQVLLHPIEVKVGNCTQNEIQKGVEQSESTYSDFMKCYWSEARRDRLATRIARNAFMQKVITSAEKLIAYGILPTERWHMVIEDYRMALQNEQYEIVPSEQVNMLHGTVIAFANDVIESDVSNADDIRILRIPEEKIPDVTVGEQDQVWKIAGRYDYETITSSKPAFEDEGEQQPNCIESESDVSKTEEAVDGESKYTLGNASSAFALNNHLSNSSNNAAGEGIRILFGTNRDTGKPVFWEPCDTSKLFHTNTGIIGTMGTGKTQFTKSMIAQIYANRASNPGNAELGILIFDYKGDYNSTQTDFVNATDAVVLQPYRLPFNPLTISNTPNSLPLLPKHVANTFKDTLIRACSSSKMGAVQANTLFNCIMSAYELKQIDPRDRSAWDRTPPTFETVYRIYSDDEDVKKNDSLASIMDKVHEFEIFESDPNKTRSLYDLLKGVVVIDLSGYDPDIQSLVVGMMLDLFYSQMHTHGHSRLHGNLRELSKFILVDEADNFLSQGFPSLRKILKEGREFGVGTILSTQFLKHFAAKDEDFSKYILTWVVHNVADLDAGDIRFVFNTTPKSDEENHLYEEVKRLGKHCSLVKLGDAARAISLKDKPFWELVIESSAS